MILVLNCGSQSIKLKVFDASLKAIKEADISVREGENYKKILHDELSKVRGFKVRVVGHRVVHGKDIFKKPTKITSETLYELEKISRFAPLHNHYNVLGIKTCQEIFRNVAQYAVFDTEFFIGLPEKSQTYALPQEIVSDFGFRKYGFHGISHEFVAKEAAKKIKKPFEKIKIITCHLGGGASITAIKNGKAIDTSMGFTPLQGLVMMTRPGDIDAGIVLELSKKFGANKASEILNKESGLRGICREGDMLRVLERTRSPEEPQRRRAELALNVFVYSVQKYIGSYFAILGGCDALVFTGSIGSGSAKIRNMITKDLKILKNTKVLAIKTDEELAIAQKIKNII